MRETLLERSAQGERLLDASAARRIIAALLAIEFVDELVSGLLGAAWPSIREELGLSYAQIGILLSTPGLIGSALELPLGILSDQRRRLTIILAGGVAFTASVALVATAGSYGWLLAALCLFSPASGAFVSLSQAALMDTDPERHERLMVWWTVSGGIAVVLGPAALAASWSLGWGWRAPLLAMGALSLALTLAVALLKPPQRAVARSSGPSLLKGLGEAARLMLEARVLRWLVLLALADLVLELLVDLLALYMVDIVHLSQSGAASAVMLWRGAGLAGEVVLVWLLTRIEGVRVVRTTAAIAAVLIPCMLALEAAPAKLVIVGLLGFVSAGWYSVGMARLYTELPGRSGAALTICAIFGVADGLVPAALGWLAQRAGLEIALGLVALAPVGILILLRRPGPEPEG